MKTLTHWVHLWPVGLGVLAWNAFQGWLKQARRDENRAECGQPPALKRGPYPESFEPSEADQAEYSAWLVECDEAEDLAASEWLAHEHDSRSDGWYLDLLSRAAFPSHGWRDGDVA